MNLYITNRELPALTGVVYKPEHMCELTTHLVLASRNWDILYIDVDESIPEGSLRLLRTKCSRIRVMCPERPSMHQTHLLIELYPELAGILRKAQMKGDSVYGILPEMWKHGTTA